MAKRSREDFEPPAASPESEYTGEPLATARSVIHPSTINSASSPKFLQLDPESGETTASSVAEMRCSLPPHRQTLSFATFEEYDVHYAKAHVNRCLECRKNFPTEHFLNLHIEENHDALITVRKERGEKTYGCFVEDCDRKCSTPQKRRMHLIDKHMFPKDYDFYIINDGIDRRSSMLRSGKHRRRSSAAQHMGEIDERTRQRNSALKATKATEPTEQKATSSDSDGAPTPSAPKDIKEDTEMEGLSSAMSSLKFVPPSVRFGGRGRGRGGRGGFSKS